MRRLCQLIVLLVMTFVCPAQTMPLTLPVGGLADGKVLAVTGAVALIEPDGPRGQFKHGFWLGNDNAADWQHFYGVQFEMKLPDAREVALTATILRAQRNTNVAETPVHGTVGISGKGWHTVTLPWSAFDFPQANTSFLKYVKDFTIAGKMAPGSPPKFQLRNVRVVAAPVVALMAEVRGRSAPRNGSVEYAVQVGNCLAVPQSVSLALVQHGWEEMTATVEPNALSLAPGEVREVQVRVTVPDRVPPGGH